MNVLPLILWSAFATLAAAALSGLLVAGALRRRRSSRDAVLRTKYLHVLMLSLLADDGTVPRFPLIGCPGARLLLAETLAGVVGTTYGLDADPLRRIVGAYDLDGWLLRRVRRSRGYRRARYLSLLACLPCDERTVAAVVRHARSRNPQVRFQTLLVRLVADPSAALRLMAAHPAPFTPCEVAEILIVLRRGMLPIAYEPLLNSPVRNLRCVGLGIVARFGIEEAEGHLLRIVESDDDPALGREALYTLCAMRRRLVPGRVSRRIAGMAPAARRALLRFMAAEGYAPAALEELFDRSEQPYFESLVLSYKRTLACR